MMMKKPVCLEGELIFPDAIYPAFVENISDDGMYVSVAHVMTKEHIEHEKNIHLKVRLPSGRPVLLVCKEKWAERNTSRSLIERIGLEIIDPPSEFKKYLESR